MANVQDEDTIGRSEESLLKLFVHFIAHELLEKLPLDQLQHCLRKASCVLSTSVLVSFCTPGHRRCPSIHPCSPKADSTGADHNWPGALPRLSQHSVGALEHPSVRESAGS